MDFGPGASPERVCRQSAQQKHAKRAVLLHANITEYGPQAAKYLAEKGKDCKVDRDQAFSLVRHSDSPTRDGSTGRHAGMLIKGEAVYWQVAVRSVCQAVAFCVLLKQEWWYVCGCPKRRPGFR